MRNKRGKLPQSLGTPRQLRNNHPSAAVPLAPLNMSPLTRTLDYAERVRNNPVLLVEDAADYKDQKYVCSLAQLFFAIASATELPIMKIKKVRISNMELALAKLQKEEPEAYKELGKYWGVIPEKHSSKTPTKGVSPHNHLVHLTKWGYFDLFFPNMEEIIDLVLQKTSTTSTSMSKVDQAKYANIFALFITGHSFMPYDLGKCLEVKQNLEKTGQKVDIAALRNQILNSIMSTERKGFWNAAMLYHFYTKYMQALPDGAINLDSVVFFLDLIDYQHKLIIKENMSMLSDEEKSDFKAMHLSPISSNLDIRKLKEEMFPAGIWHSNLTLFMTTISNKERRAYARAYNCFAKNGFLLGKDVEGIKNPITYQHALSKESYTVYGYLYARSPLTVRVSDLNEIWMMKTV